MVRTMIIISLYKLWVWCFLYGAIFSDRQHFLLLIFMMITKRGRPHFTCTSFVERAIAHFGEKFDYSRVDYKHSQKGVIIGCPKHGWFEKTPSGFLASKHGCPSCGWQHTGKCISKKMGGKSKFSRVEWKNKSVVFFEKCTRIHCGRYGYSKARFVGVEKKICIICPKHGEFWQQAQSHQQGKGCPKCRVSKGEARIIGLLTEWKIPFNHNHKFDDCRGVNGGMLKFDFYLPEQKIFVEFDGEQHYGRKKVYNHKLSDEKVKQMREHDRRKTNYAMFNGIRLVRIPYFRMNKIEEILKEELLYGKK